MGHDLRKLPCDGTVHILDNVEIGREEDIKVALLDLEMGGAMVSKSIILNGD